MKKNIMIGRTKYLSFLMGTIITCVLILFSHSSKAKPHAFTSYNGITNLEKIHTKKPNIFSEKSKTNSFYYSETRLSMYRKKFQIGGDSYIEFKAAENYLQHPALNFQNLDINYRNPNIVTAIKLFIHRLASF